MKCYTCGGKGNIVIQQKFQNDEKECDKCAGFGQVIKEICPNCEGIVLIFLGSG